MLYINALYFFLHFKMFIIVGLMWAIVGFNMLVVVYFGWLGDSNK